jgi:hypothetical protein
MKNLRWWLPAAILLFGVLAVGNWTSVKWISITLFLYSLPLLCQLQPNKLLRVYSLWFGIFLILQTLVTPLVIDRNYLTLPPNAAYQIDVRGEALPGISGVQTVSTDSQGFRTTKDVNYEEKPEGTYRIFAIGGSTTEQILLDDRSTWTHLLQERLDEATNIENVEVINTGVSGTRARQHLATLNRVTGWDPDMVVFLVGINDWNRGIWDELGAPQQNNPGQADSAFRFSDSLMGLSLGVVNALFVEEPAPSVRPEYGEYYSEQNNSLTRPVQRTFRPATVSDSYREVLEAIVARCEQSDITCMFVTQPSAYSLVAGDEIKRFLWMTPPNTDYTLDLPSLVHVAATYNGFLMDLADSSNMAQCDLAANIEPTLDVFYDDCHFNTNGARQVAGILAKCIAATVNRR